MTAAPVPSQVAQPQPAETTPDTRRQAIHRFHELLEIIRELQKNHALLQWGIQNAIDNLPDTGTGQARASLLTALVDGRHNSEGLGMAAGNLKIGLDSLTEASTQEKADQKTAKVAR